MCPHIRANPLGPDLGLFNRGFKFLKTRGGGGGMEFSVKRGSTEPRAPLLDLSVLMHKNCWISSKQCKPRSDATERVQNVLFEICFKQ